MGRWCPRRLSCPAQLLTYVSGGYTQAHWQSTNLSFFGVATPSGVLPGDTKGGWFIGTGDEYALTGFLPGLFWKTEYRYSEFERSNVGRDRCHRWPLPDVFDPEVPREQRAF